MLHPFQVMFLSFLTETPICGVHNESGATAGHDCPRRAFADNLILI